MARNQPMNAALMELRIHNGTFKIDPETGDMLKRCSTCREYFPMDRDFFHHNKHEADHFMRQCKACYIGYSRKAAEKRRARLQRG